MDRLDNLLARWDEAYRQGKDIPAAELCREQPHLTPQLQTAIEERKRQAEAGNVLTPPTRPPSASEPPLTVPPLPEDTVPPVPAAELNLPGYEILGELGRGGMGVVYKARQSGTNRLVALKMVLHGDSSDLDRFRREAISVARLQHPHIIQIHEVGESNHKPYFSLELCQGSLEERLRGGVLSPVQAATLVATLARAMQAAHQANVVHRDLKPANVLLAAPNVPDELVPKIADFGLAKMLDVPTQTHSGTVMGTPSYMAPEQARGRSDVGASADLYALGGILYACLTGRPPFLGGSTLETLEMVVMRDPVPPRQLQPTVPRDLETICLKCLQKEPARRYASAQDLAEDLDRLGRGEAIKARPIGLIERGVKWARRRPAVTSLLALILLLSVLAGVLIAWQYGVAVEESNHAKREEGKARHQQAVAERAEQHAKNQETLATTNARLAETQADLARQQTRIAQARLLAIQSRENLERYPQTALHLAAEAVQHTARVKEPVVPIAEQLLRTALSELRGRGLGSHREAVTRLELSPNGRWAATASADKTLRLWDLKASTPASAPVVIAAGGTVELIAFDATSTHLAAVAATHSKQVNLIVCDLRANDSATASKVVKLSLDRLGWLSGSELFFNPAGTRLCLAGSGTPARPLFLWDLTSKEPFSQTMELLPGTPGCDLLARSNRGRWLLTLPRSAPRPTVTELRVPPDNSPTQPLHLWDLNATDVRSSRVLIRPANGPRLLANFSLDERCLVTDDETGALHRWDLTQDVKTRVAVAVGKQEPGFRTALSPDGQRLVTLAGTGELRLWNLEGDAAERTPVELSKSVPASSSLHFCGAGLLVNDTRANFTQVWNLSTRTMTRLEGNLRGMQGAWVETRTADGKSFLNYVTGEQPQVQMLSDPAPQKKRSRVQFDVAAGKLPDASGLFSADGRWLAKVGDKNAILLWKLEPPEQRKFGRHSFADSQAITLRGHEDPITGLRFTAGGQHLVTISEDTTVRLWELGDFKRLQDPAVILSMRGNAFASEFEPTVAPAIVASPDSKWLLATRSDSPRASLLPLGGAMLLEAATRPAPLALQGHRAGITAATFTPDSRWAVTASLDGSVRLWPVTTSTPGQPPLVLDGHEGPIVALAISPDGRWLTTGSADASASVWDLTARDPRNSRRSLRGHTDTVWTVLPSPNSRWLATASASLAMLWDLHASNPVGRSLAGHTAELNCLRFSSDSRRLITGGQDQAVRVWEVDAAQPPASATTLGGLSAPIREVGVSLNGDWVALGSQASTPLWWDLRQPTPQSANADFQKHNHTTFLADRRWLLSWEAADAGSLPREVAGGLTERFVRLWDVTSARPQQRRLMLPLTGDVETTTDGRWLLVRDTQQPACLLDLKADQPFTSRVELPRGELPAHLSPDGNWLLSPGATATSARLWHLAQFPDRVHELTGHGEAVAAAAFSADGKRLATLSGDSVRLWDLTAANPGQALRTVVLRAPKPASDSSDEFAHFSTGAVGSVVLNRDGRWLGVVSWSNPMKIWDLQETDTAAPRVLQGVTAVTTSPTGRWIVTRDQQGSSLLWDFATGLVGQPRLRLGTGLAVFSANDARLALVRPRVGEKGATGLRLPAEVQLWDLPEGKAPQARGGLFAFGQLPLPPKDAKVVIRWEDYLSAVAFSHDGNLLATRNAAGTGQVYDLTRTTLDTPLELPSKGSILGFAFHPRAPLVAGSNLNGELHRWRLTPTGAIPVGDPLQGLMGGRPRFSGDGRWLVNYHLPAGYEYQTTFVTTLLPGSALLWDLGKPEAQPRELLGHVNRIRTALFNSDQSRLVTISVTTEGPGSGTSEVRLWDVRTGEPSESSVVLPEIPCLIRNALVTTDDRWLIAAGEDGKIRLIALRSEDLVAQAYERAGRALSHVEARLFRLDRLLQDAAVQARWGEHCLEQARSYALAHEQKAIAEFRAADQLFAGLAEKFPNEARYRTALEQTRVGLADYYYEQGTQSNDWVSGEATALEALRSAEQILVRLAQQYPDKDYRWRLVNTLVERATLHLKKARTPANAPATQHTDLTAAAGAFTRALTLLGSQVAPKDEAARAQLVYRCEQSLGVLQVILGRDEHQRGQGKKAAAAFGTALEHFDRASAASNQPPNVDVTLHRALANAALGRWSHADAALAECVARAPQDQSLALGEFMLHSKQGRLIAARAALERLLPARPQGWWTGAADHLRVSGSFWTEMAAFADLVGSESDAWPSLARGLLAAATQDWAGAATHFRQGIARQPHDQAHHWGLALAVTAHNDWQQTLRSSSESLRLQQRDEGQAAAALVGTLAAPGFTLPALPLTTPAGSWRAWYLRGIAHARTNRFDLAESDLSAAIGRGATGWGIRAQRGYVRFNRSRWAECVDDCTAAIAQGAEHYHVWLNRADANWRLEQWALAVKDYDAILKRQDVNWEDSKRIRLNRGWAHQQLGNWEEARADYTAYLMSEPRDAWTLSSRGYVQAALKEWTKASADFHAALKVDPQDAETWQQLYLATLARNDPGTARTYLKKMLEQFPSPAKADVASVLLAAVTLQPDPVAAPELLLKWSELMVRAASANSDGKSLRGMALYRAGKFKEANDLLAQALKSANRETAIRARYFLAMALHQLGQAKEAAAELKRATEDTAKLGADALWDFRIQATTLEKEASELLSKKAGTDK